MQCKHDVLGHERVIPLLRISELLYREAGAFQATLGCVLICFPLQVDRNKVFECYFEDCIEGYVKYPFQTPGTEHHISCVISESQWYRNCKTAFLGSS